MKIELFEMERMQSTWEFEVDHNLSESGVHPLTFRELVPSENIDDILDTELGYIQTNGPAALRDAVSRLYPGTTRENILVTTGSAEANFLVMWSQIEPGDEVLFMLPNYMQMGGLLKAFGAQVVPYYLREDLGWAPDMDEVKKAVNKKTKMIIATNPNNPTGAVLSRKNREAIIGLAEWADAWILSDEVYQGAELDGAVTPSFWGTSKKVLVTNGLSKAYGLPGLRMGWMVAPEEFIQKTWPYHDYTTICLSAVSHRLARVALEPDKRKEILLRTKTILRTNLPLFEEWLNRQDGLFNLVPPRAGAIAFPRQNLGLTSVRVVDKLRQDKSVLIVPGEHFGLGKYLRFGFGAEKEYLLQALGRVEEFLKEIRR
jgi:aspartate/methionine/tyrosine aminotransferase